MHVFAGEKPKKTKRRNHYKYSLPETPVDNYARDIASASVVGTIPTLIRWDGSLFKALFPWMLVYIAFYYGVYAISVHAVTFSQTIQLRDIAIKYVAVYQETIPVVVVLGVYIRYALQRWWDCVVLLPEPTNAILLACFVFQENAFEERRKFCRYIKTCWLTTMCGVSQSLKEKYPDNASFVEQELLTEEECEILDMADSEIDHSPKPWLLGLWARNCIKHNIIETHETDDLFMGLLETKTNSFHKDCAKFLDYFHTGVSLYATQFCVWTVHIYGLLALVGNSFVPWLDTPHPYILTLVGLFYVPFFSWLKYIYFCGGLQCVHVLLHPFGRDYEDVKMIELAESHFKIVEVMQEHFDDPGILDLDSVFFTEEGELRPYFYEEIPEEELDIFLRDLQQHTFGRSHTRR